MSNKIDDLKLESRFFLAPMLEPNDIAFRMLCKKAGCALTYTGMVSPLSKKKFEIEDKPAMQIFGNSSKGIKKFMKKYDEKVSLWDFNLGCPSKLSKKMKHGAFMHNQLHEIEKILKTMRESTKKPLTVKLRKSENAIEIAKIAEKYVDAIGIHPRTFSQGYSGESDLDFALKLKKSVNVPIIYSGDVNEKNAKELLKKFDFIFVGRAAIGNSNIFSELTGKDLKLHFFDYLELALEYNLPFRQIKYQAMNFTKGMKNARKFRGKIIKAKSIEEIKLVMGE